MFPNRSAIGVGDTNLWNADVVLGVWVGAYTHLRRMHAGPNPFQKDLARTWLPQEDLGGFFPPTGGGVYIAVPGGACTLYRYLYVRSFLADASCRQPEVDG